jgi:hypothetical protein
MINLIRKFLKKMKEYILFVLMMSLLEINNIRMRYVPELWVKMRMGSVTKRNLKNIWNQN